MLIPSFVIIPIFLICFLSSAYQYYVVDPVRRLTDVRAFLTIGSILGMFAQETYRVVWPEYWQPSVILFGLSLFMLALSLAMLRRMPPPTPYR